MPPTRPLIDPRRTASAVSRRRPPRPMGPSRPLRASHPGWVALRRDPAARATGGPDDTARYDCACGCAFRARVTTSVACPHCGTLQAW